MTDSILLYVNGGRRVVKGADAGLTLSTYLRRGSGGAPLCGTKIACAEGDCGACTVLVGRPTDGGRLLYEPIDACIAFVYQMHRRHVVTVEGIAGGGRLTEVQQAMVDCHGSQCGFCTPGFVMALHGLAELAEAPLTEEQLRLGLSGNLCRCTGYAQILDAGHAVEPAEIASVGARYDAKEMLTEFATLDGQAVHVNPSEATQSNGHPREVVEVMVPQTLPQLLDFRTRRPGAKLVAGATDVGVQHNHGRLAPDAVLHTGQIAELDAMTVEDGVLTVGAATRWSTLLRETPHLAPELHAVLTRFGSPQVRHAGTLAGNLANASPIADSLPFLYVAGATVELASERRRRSAPIEQFYLGYKQLDLAADEVIASVRVPLPEDPVRVKLYKISRRRDMDISTVTAAFWLRVDGDQITDARVAFGGVGPTVLRLPRCEAAMTGASFSLDTLAAAGRTAREEVTPISDVRGDATYRLQLVENLFSKCYHDLSPQPLRV